MSQPDPDRNWARRLPRKDYEAAKQKLFAQIRDAQNRAAEARVLARLQAKHPPKE